MTQAQRSVRDNFVFIPNGTGLLCTVSFLSGAIAVLVGGPADTSVQAVEPSSVFRISARTLTEAARCDARVAWAIAEELNRRLYEVLEQSLPSSATCS
jgi:hypothetical protein